MTSRTLPSSTNEKRPRTEEPATTSQKGAKKCKITRNAMKVPAATDARAPRALEIVEEVGDIFDAPVNTILIHACNCEGVWGAGIAKGFKDRYSQAYAIYKNHCENNDTRTGSALLIRPQEGDAKKHFVGCLLTSASKGKKKDSVDDILAATRLAMESLLDQAKHTDNPISEWRMCKINSGLFRVPWERTRTVLEEIALPDGSLKTVIRVISPP